MISMEYNVQVEAFRGPLDLLLFLVKRHEVDICDIPIAQVAEHPALHAAFAIPVTLADAKVDPTFLYLLT